MPSVKDGPVAKSEMVIRSWPYILSSLKTYLERGSAMALTEALRKERGE